MKHLASRSSPAPVLLPLGARRQAPQDGKDVFLACPTHPGFFSMENFQVSEMLLAAALLGSTGETSVNLTPQREVKGRSLIKKSL